MLKKIFRILFIPIGAAIGYWVWKLVELIIRQNELQFLGWAATACVLFSIALFAVIGFFAGKPASSAISQLLSKIIKRAREMPAKEMFLACGGLLFGFLAAFLVCQIFNNLSNEVLVTCLNIIVYLCCGILGVRIAMIKHDDIPLPVRKKRGEEFENSGGTVLDSSILIDGRVYDIYKTGFIQGPIYIPKFILSELSRLADSEDGKKRQRGRMGLDMIKRLQQEEGVQIEDRDYEDLESIDDKIIRFAAEKKANIMTNDYGLNMVASLQGVKIFNLNELANALKPTVIAGDVITVSITKEGKDPSQGVGYLSDGTMVVIEDGSSYINTEIEAVVTSMLQTNAGKIIFAKPK